VTYPLHDTKYLHFDELPNEGKRTRRFHVFSVRQGMVLGRIAWFGRWRQYVFEPNPGTVFNNECLTSLADRLGYLNTMHRPSTVEHPEAKPVGEGGVQGVGDDRDPQHGET
jgi:hypothetical protein